MATAFNMLRPNDLIWPYVVNNYMKGKEPFPFDLLYWNSDSTRMPAANHAFYLRNCYLENKLAKGEMELGGVQLDLEEGEDPDLQSRGARGPHRAGALGVRRLEGFRRPGRLRAGGLGPHRRRRQPGRPSRNTSTGPAGRSKASSRTGSPRRRSIPAPGGRTGSRGSRSRRPKRVPRARARRRQAQAALRRAREPTSPRWRETATRPVCGAGGFTDRGTCVSSELKSASHLSPLAGRGFGLRPNERSEAKRG